MKGIYVDLIPASTGYLGATGVRSSSLQRNGDTIFERDSKILEKKTFVQQVETEVIFESATETEFLRVS